MAATVRIGTCSWADEALSKYFYPKGVPAGERLAWYAQHFDTVEVDSTYYRLPSVQMVERWAERTPEGFTMHVKAFALMTRHPVKLEQLPPELRDETLAWLEQMGATHVIVDAPRSETAKNIAPTVPALTSPILYVRFHGRNLATWNKRGGSAAERFDYLYSDEELEEWAGPLCELAAQAEEAYAFFNNNSSSPSPGAELGRVAQAAAYAAPLRA